MDTLYLILYILAAVCFVAAAFVTNAVTTATNPRPVYTRVNLVALGLLFWVLVPLIVTIDRLG